MHIFGMCRIAIRKIASRALVIKELLTFLWKNKLWWMVPIIIVFVLLGLLVLFAQSSAVLPFVYSLF